MIVNNLFFLSLLKIVLICLLIYLLIILIDQIREKYRKKFDKEELKKSSMLAQIYLDQFYINNKLYTFSVNLIYIFCMTIGFILVRYLAIGDIVNILPQGNLYISVTNIFFVYILLFITIILYRSLITMLCIKEVNKLYIYIIHFYWFNSFKAWINFKFMDSILGSIYLITYRIATLTYKENMYPVCYDEKFGYDYICFDESNYEIHNKLVINWAYKFKLLAQKYPLLQKFFKILASIFRFLFKHNRSIYEPLPYFILISIFFIDLYTKEFNNIYLVSFIYIIIKTKRDFVTYIETRDITLKTLSYYFYANNLAYKKQRINFFMDDQINIEPILSSIENHNLFIKELNNVIECTFNNFMEKTDSIEYKQHKKKFEGIYRRFFLIILFMFVGYTLCFNIDIKINLITKLILLLPTLIMIYAHYNTYYIKEYIKEIDLEIDRDNFVYSRIHNILFWLSTIFQAYIFWTILLKAQVTFMDTNILWDIGIKIIKIYTVDEKILYLYQYFEYCLTGGTLPTAEQDYLRYLIRTIDFKHLIDNNIALKDIQIYIKLFIENYTYIDIFYKYNNQEILNEILWERVNSSTH